MGTTTNAPKRYTSSMYIGNIAKWWLLEEIKHSAKYSAKYFQWDFHDRYHKWFATLVFVVLFRLIRGQNLAVDTRNTCVLMLELVLQALHQEDTTAQPPNCLHIMNYRVTGVRQICQKPLLSIS